MPPPATATTACAVCGGLHGRTHHAREMMFGLRDAFTYGECDACGCLQLLDPPADMGRYYGPDYYSFGGDLDAEFADPAVREARGAAVRDFLTLPGPEASTRGVCDMPRPLWSLRPLLFRQHTRVLDVGCGSGRLLYLMSLAGHRGGCGADPFIPADITYRSGLRILKRELSQMEGGWELIMMHHAFEHLADPARTLGAAAERLVPGGRLLLRLPLADSEAWRAYGVDWVQLDAPRHLFLHTRTSLRTLAAAAGLNFENAVCDAYEFQFWGSEQYRRDIPLHDPRSRWGGRPGIFSDAQIEAWRARSHELNTQDRGDQAAVYFRKPD